MFIINSVCQVGAQKGAPIFFGPTGFAASVKGKQATIIEVENGSPGEGKLKVGATIVGVDGNPFSDPRRDLTRAIDEAEGKNAGGTMRLSMADGQTISLQLQVLGDYGPTAPYRSEKVDVIIRNSAKQLHKEPVGRLAVEILALMATGEKTDMDIARQRVQEGPWMELRGERLENAHLCIWPWSYRLIMLSEYYLLTKDRSVLPAIKSYAVSLAWGQDPRGMYGHKMSDPANYYKCYGYGAMNQTTLSAYLGMLLAKKCGLKDPRLEHAIRVTGAYVKQYAWEGSFPYGGGGPYSGAFNNNGTSGLAAVCMEVAGDPHAAQFFAQCAATSYDDLEKGHASAYFNPLWTSLGAARTGPWVTVEYFKRILSYHNLRRRHDGGWAPDWKPGTHDAVALLTYCLGRRKLIITGREMDRSIWSSKEDAAEIIGFSREKFEGKSAQELIKLAVEHPMPQLRRLAGGSLDKHRQEMTPHYVTWLKSGSTVQKLTAVNQYAWWIKPEVKRPHLDAIGRILTNPDEPLHLRIAAANSVAYMGADAQKYYMDLVRIAHITGDEEMGKKLFALCPHPLKENLVQEKDKAVFYEVALKLAEGRDQKVRGAGFRMLHGMPIEDFHLAVNQITGVFEADNPAWTSYSNPGHDVAAAVELLASLNIKEGLNLALKVYDSRPIGKVSFRTHATWAAMRAYGGNAKGVLKQYHERFGTDKKYGRAQKAYEEMVKAIEEDHSPPKLIAMADAIARGKK